MGAASGDAVEIVLLEAASLAGFDAAKGWPVTWEPRQAVALQGHRLGTKLVEYKRQADRRELNRPAFEEALYFERIEP